MATPTGFVQRWLADSFVWAHVLPEAVRDLYPFDFSDLPHWMHAVEVKSADVVLSSQKKKTRSLAGSGPTTESWAHLPAESQGTLLQTSSETIPSRASQASSVIKVGPGQNLLIAPHPHNEHAAVDPVGPGDPDDAELEWMRLREENRTRSFQSFGDFRCTVEKVLGESQ